MKKIILIFTVLILIVLGFLFIFDKDIKEQESVTIQKQDSKNLFQVTVCGKNYVAGPIYVEGADITKRIIELLEKEYQVTQNKESATCSTLMEFYPAGTVLETGSTKINSNQYRVVFEYEFLVDVDANLIYNVNAIDGSRGTVLGTFK